MRSARKASDLRLFRSLKATTVFAHLLVAILVASSVGAPESRAQETAPPASEEESLHRGVPIPLTESPRDTLKSFLDLKDALEETILRYQDSREDVDIGRIQLIMTHLRSLIDLSEVAITERRFVGTTTVNLLLDIFGRIEPIDIESVPDESAFDAGGSAQWRVPNTPLRIVRLEADERAGDFVFGRRTPRVAALYLEGIEDLALNTRLDTTSWTRMFAQITGPAVPRSFVLNLPAALRKLWLDTPVWKTLVFVGAAGLATIAIAFISRLIRRKKISNPVLAIVAQMTVPAAIIATISIVFPIILLELILAGRGYIYISRFLLVMNILAGARLFWLFARLLAEWLIYSPAVKDGTLDANLVRLVSAIVGTIGVVVILAAGAQTMGVPFLSLLTGLGIGGVAIALAIRPTLENLIGGMILYIDRPVKIGDFCTFGGDSGTIESIGVRSTQIRALDRTLISVPNAQFVDMKLVNWAECDQMLIRAVIGLRYETTPDQMRFVLNEIREVLQAHPRIDPETVRVRYAGPAESSRDIEIRIYATTQEWNDFYAIREDVFLRVDAIVDEAGSGYAFPSQTLYLRRDDGIDAELQSKAVSAVDSWRHNGRLPFPHMSRHRTEALKGTLDYPPRGSVDRRQQVDGGETRTAEPLSTPPAGEEPREGGDDRRARDADQSGR